MLTVKQQVDNGILWLEKHYPDWRTDIKWDVFDIVNPELCIIGQLVGSSKYANFVHPKLEEDADWMIKRGFAWGNNSPTKLQEEWLSRIA